MKPTEPTKRTTLALNAHFMAIGFFTARDTMRHLVTGGVKAFDADGNLVPWSAPLGELSWTSGVSLYPDQPSLRSTSAEWAIPTIVVLQRYTGFPRKKRSRGLSLRQIYNLYDQTCQYCLNEINFDQATKDHVVPRAKGGGNQASNLVLACRKCNARKADKFPYLNVNRKEVEPKILGDLEILDHASITHPRPEWMPFLPNKVAKKKPGFAFLG